MSSMLSRCLILFAASAALPAAAQSDAEYSAEQCAEAKTYLKDGGDILHLAGGNWIIQCDAIGESATSKAVEARMRAAMAQPDTDPFVRANLGMRLALAYVERKKIAEAASLALAAQTDYLGQPERNEFTEYWFESVFNKLGIALTEQPELAAPHLDARVKFLEMLRGSEMHGYLPELMQPLALTIALGNALELEDLDRAALHASHMARLRAATPAGERPPGFLAPSLIAKVAHALSRAGRFEEAKSIVGDDAPVSALAAAYAALDAANPSRPDLDLALRSMLAAVDNPWWRAAREQPMDRELKIVAGILDGVADALRHGRRSADAEHLQTFQHPQYAD